MFREKITTQVSNMENNNRIIMDEANKEDKRVLLSENKNNKSKEKLST